IRVRPRLSRRACPFAEEFERLAGFSLYEHHAGSPTPVLDEGAALQLRPPDAEPVTVRLPRGRRGYNPGRMPGLDPASFRFCPRCGKSLEPQAAAEGAPTRAACAACGFVHYLDPKLAACTIFMVDGGVVLVQRANDPQKGTWVLPGGYVDRGE